MGKAEGISHAGLVDELGMTGVIDVGQSILLSRKKNKTQLAFCATRMIGMGRTKRSERFGFVISNKVR